MNEVEALKDITEAASDLQNAAFQLIARDIGGCLQCITFTMQRLEMAKAKLEET